MTRLGLYITLAVLTIIVLERSGHREDYVIDPTPIAMPVCPMANPCDRIDCDRGKPMEMS